MCRCFLSYYPYNAGPCVLFITTPQNLIEMPKFTELVARIVALVTEETEIPGELILSKSRTAEVVDARHLAIRLMYSKDIYPKRIAEAFGLSARSVRHIITTFDARIQANRSLGSNLAKIRKQLGDNSEITRFPIILSCSLSWR